MCVSLVFNIRALRVLLLPFSLILYRTRPFDVVGVDLLKMPTSATGAEYLFVAVDHFSRYLVLVPLFDKTARSVARAFTQHVICPFTAHRVLFSDNGT